ncbi:MAG: CdaR family protein [Bacillota bacterium]|nr:CdaR family protein [Bacillota bacterium]
MKNKFTHNIGLKLASVFFAVILWLVVTSVNNPTVSEPYYNIPVKLINTEMITDSGQVYEVLDNTDVISKVTVRAPHSVISELKSENIIATADVSEISSLDTIAIKLSTDIYANNISSITGSIDTVKLKIENKKSKALSLKSTVSGQVTSGYMVGEITPDQNLVRISGPESVIDQVTKAVVDVDVTGMTSDIVTNAEIKLYDAEDNIVDTKNITQNIKTVGVKVNIWQTATVSVNFSASGTPAAGYQATGEIIGSGENVVIAGKASAIRNITQINIPEDVLDISDLTQDYTTEVDIRPYLPDYVILANSKDAIRTVTVCIEGEISKKLQVREERVQIINLPEGYDASITGLEETFIIEIIGLSRDVATLQASNISGTIDIKDFTQERDMTDPEPGFYTVEVDFGLPDNVSLLEPVTVTLHISKSEEE